MTPGLPPFRPFELLGQALRPPSPLRDAVTRATRRDEVACVQALLPDATLPDALQAPIAELAKSLTQRLRDQQNGRGRAKGRMPGKARRVQALMQEFSLSTQEGVSLMCLAEALLRIPDDATRDALIRAKVGDADWAAHLGRSHSLFVNATTWGLLLTDRLVGTHEETGLYAALRRVAAKGGEPLIRRAVDAAMRMLGEQFVIGQHIDSALARARTQAQQGYRHSFDMLGEAALTAQDAQRYLQAYEDAIHAIGQTAQGLSLYEAPGISIKLSALHPRYSRAQYARVMDELYPRLLDLVKLACRYNIGLNIDAEESERLELSLDLLERLCHEPTLQGWDGIGFVVQAYQKRCPQVLDFLIDLARRSGHRLMVRLVKGAYWDSEIKRAQIEGQSDYPVYTRKVHTDAAYIACARRLLARPAEVFPQFATHNACTLAAIHHLAGPGFHIGQYEFQCLHGMGEPLYDEVIGPAEQGGLARPCRIYAPVGSHDTLLAYLVRRLLENGANSSFVHRVGDARIPLDSLVADAATTIREETLGTPHPAIPLPGRLYGDARANAPGFDLNDEATLAALHRSLMHHGAQAVHAGPLIASSADPAAGPAAGASAAPTGAPLHEDGHPREPVRNPGERRDTVGSIRWTSEAELAAAAELGARHARIWRQTPVATRAALLEAAADKLHAHHAELMNLLVREAGKTLPNAVGELREAIDFLRYYAAQARLDLRDGGHEPLGVLVCISPWNFPLAIFIGQIAAALAAGNTVLAKPAEQTSLIAARATTLMHEAGIPREALQLLPGPGETVGAALVARPEVAGVLFTGSTQVARQLQASLAGRVHARGTPLTLIAETGGQNAMIVDSSALPEQVVGDVMASAFDSAGQRCSALRVLCLQEDIADTVLTMLKGAMNEWCLGPTDRLRTDIGPLIDEDARQAIARHIDAMRANGRPVFQPAAAVAAVQEHGSGCFIPPTLIELESLQALTHEVFGPVLHVLRFRRERLGALIDDIHATGYGLTMGLHSRVDETIALVTQKARVGNLYVNRNMIGAVVGVQPFGGEGLSGTGPKAGGPLYLHRLVHPDAQHFSQAPTLRAMAKRTAHAGLPALDTLRHWLAQQPGLAHAAALRQHCEWLMDHSPAGYRTRLNGPTGEENTYSLRPRGPVLCLARQQSELIYQLATVLAVGSRAIWPAPAGLHVLLKQLPAEVQACVDVIGAPQAHADLSWQAVLMHGEPSEVCDMAKRLADRPGEIVPLLALPRGWLQPGAFSLAMLLKERSVSVNTAAAGGNASLMTLD